MSAERLVKGFRNNHVLILHNISEMFSNKPQSVFICFKYHKMSLFSAKYRDYVITQRVNF